MTTPNERHSRVLILGSGPAGLTAAVYAGRANLNPILFEGRPADPPGGQLMLTTEVENYPGFPAGVTGPELIEQMKKQAERFGTKFVPAGVTSVNLSRRPFEAVCEGQTYTGDTLVIATGASANWLGLPNEQRLRMGGGGVSACATCDGFFYKNLDIAVVGGGDTAMEEATFLTKFGKTVTVIHRRDSLRASKIMQDRAMNNPKIKFLWNTAVVDVLGDKRIEGLTLESVKTKERTTFPCQGLFLAIGHTPNTELFKGTMEMTDTGYLITTPGRAATSIPGVFCAGDVADHYYRQAITAAGTGCMAAIEAERWLEANPSHS
jgi:thioredoxin reductase (NADPH)